MFLAKTPETFVHDADGNLMQDGHWTYTWDGENRLVTMEALSTVPAAAKLRVEFEYDWRGQRIGKTVKSGADFSNIVYSHKLVAPVPQSDRVLKQFMNWLSPRHTCLQSLHDPLPQVHGREHAHLGRP
ncbi:MAG TPA: hypothetical protein P5555_14360 [Candidatus Paceibacterota bacterium]|nr:hypothetical protein [Kiritimatiellia bacterium]HOX03497.1 hypothetical protein [Verrucomicrobiota bacterium]HRZ46369.1 hypothetical protein [Candidatus Paceibacterota bacterium]HSA00275.1 hypothetical protein [Candidatus Paceibacterota bacterium]